jgi:hypothetical protein
MAVTGAVALPAAHAMADSRPATAQLRDDFNGDGYDDLAVAAPSAAVGGRTQAGFVWHFKSSPNLIVTPNSTGAFGTTYLGTDGTNAKFGSNFSY